MGFEFEVPEPDRTFPDLQLPPEPADPPVRRGGGGGGPKGDRILLLGLKRIELVVVRTNEEITIDAALVDIPNKVWQNHSLVIIDNL